MQDQAGSVLSEAELGALATQSLMGLGLTRKDAADTAGILVLAEMFGLGTHGVGRIESYGERLDISGINPRPSITLESIAPALIWVDGDNGVGPLVGMRAMELQWRRPPRQVSPWHLPAAATISARFRHTTTWRPRRGSRA